MEQICFPSNKYIQLCQAAAVFPSCWCLRILFSLHLSPLRLPCCLLLGDLLDQSWCPHGTGREEGWLSSLSPDTCVPQCHSLQLRALTLSFPSVPSHVWCRGHHLVSGVRPPRDHHHELRLLTVHGLDRLCPLPLWWLCHRVLLGGRADLR